MKIKKIFSKLNLLNKLKAANLLFINDFFEGYFTLPDYLTRNLVKSSSSDITFFTGYTINLIFERKNFNQM